MHYAPRFSRPLVSIDVPSVNGGEYRIRTYKAMTPDGLAIRSNTIMGTHQNTQNNILNRMQSQ